MGDTVWGGGFGAEFFVFEREAYLHTSSEENGKNKQKYNKLEENRRFSTLNKDVFIHTFCLSLCDNYIKFPFACVYAQRRPPHTKEKTIASYLSVKSYRFFGLN